MTVSGFALLAHGKQPTTDVPRTGDGPPLEPPHGGDRVAQLLAEGAGRRRLVKELGITEHKAKKLLGDRRAAKRHTAASAVAMNGHSTWTPGSGGEVAGSETQPLG